MADYTRYPHLSVFCLEIWKQKFLFQCIIWIAKNNVKKYLRYDPDGVGDFYVDADGKIYVIPVGGGLGAELKSRPNWGGEAYDELLKILNQYYKQGGKMNRIKYFQKGGAAQQGAQDMQQQVVALVQAAIQGDEKAT